MQVGQMVSSINSQQQLQPTESVYQQSLLEGLLSCRTAISSLAVAVTITTTDFA